MGRRARPRRRRRRRKRRPRSDDALLTLVEFLAPLSKATYAQNVLAVLYYYMAYEDSEGMTSEEVRAALRRARSPNATRMNVADVLAKMGAHVDTTGTRKGMKVWTLTPTGMKAARRLLDLPEAEPELEFDVATLTKLAAKIGDDEVRGFVEEAVKCLQVGALRASVVFLWTGAIRTLEQRALADHSSDVNAAIQKHDPKARTLKKVDDFAYVKDATAILAFQELGMIDRGQKGTLEEALNLRNRCGHPTRYQPGEKKVSSFVEDVVGIVF